MLLFSGLGPQMAGAENARGHPMNSMMPYIPTGTSNFLPNLVFCHHHSFPIRVLTTLGQKPTFYPEITKNLMFGKCEFCQK